MRKRLILTFIISVLTFACATASPAAAQVPRAYAANAASFEPGLSVGVNAVFAHTSFSPITAVAGSTPLPTKLAGVEVLIDGEAAGLFFVSPQQVNLLVNARFGGRTVNLDVYRNGALNHSSVYTVSLNFGVFSANARGTGLAAGLAYDPTTSEYLPLYSTTTEFGIQPIPIVAVSASGPNYLILYGTGASLAGRNVRVFVDGLECTVVYAGTAPDLAGVQQLNVALQAAFVDRGFCAVRVVVDGRGSNEVLVYFK